ncbi:MAG: glycerophosphodiester phosphodiesterase family protein [Pseudomonadota bacterium]
MRPLALTALLLAAGTAAAETPVTLGPRPHFLIDQMAESPLKDRLRACEGMEMTPRRFSIGHRGAPLQFAEHTVESNRAAARMGAGILECDVTFTADLELVCRHAQDDLHTTTDILATPLAANCTEGFRPASEAGRATAECRTSDITLAEFRTLTGKMDAADPAAETVEAYLGGTAPWRTDLYAAAGGTLMTHAESIALFRELGAAFTPELKAPAVRMPFNGFTQADYAQKLIDEYRAAGIPPEDVLAQSFNLEDVLYWIENEPAFGAQAVFLDGRYASGRFSPAAPERLEPTMEELAEMGVNYLAPPLWVLLALEDGEIVPSAYARAAREAGLTLLTWTFERSGPLAGGGGWYFQTVSEAITGDGMVYPVLDVLAQEVGVAGVFSDWPATVTYYANCMGLE